MSLRLAAVVAAAVFAPLGPLWAQTGPAFLSRDIAASPQRVTRAAVATFAEFGIPISMTDPAIGTVLGSPISVLREWNGKAVTERVRCTAATPADIASSKPVTIAVGILSEIRRLGTRTTLIIDAHAEPEGGAGAKASRDAAHRPGRQSECELTEAFAVELLDRIQMRAQQSQ
jgi:hypothetical protein